MSKISVQVQAGVVQDFPKLLAKHPVAILLLGQAVNLGIAQQIRDLSPSTLILLRAQPDNWALDSDWTKGFVSRSLTTAASFQTKGLVDFLLPPNEPVVGNPTEAKTLNDLQVSVATAYKANGYQPIAYTFPVGNPDYSLWQYLNEGIVACNGWLALHQYGSPSLQTNSADLSLRHRKVKPLLSAQVQSLLKIVVSEAGIDLGIDGKSGGYRALPQQGDNDNYWIENYTSELSWYDSELVRDDYVKAVTLFLYAGLHPWETFDVAAVDTDRSYFINWLQGGVTPPDGDNMQPTPAQTVATVPYLVKASLREAYGPGGLGQPVYGQYVAKADDGELWDCWVFLRGGQMVSQKDPFTSFDTVLLFDPRTGAPMANPLPWPTGGSPTPPSGIPPFAIPPMLTQFGASAVEGTVVAGLSFYRLTGATVRAGTSAFCKVTVIGLNGRPQIGTYVINLRPDGGKEVLATDGTGTIQFNYGAGSAFSVPGAGPFTNGIVDSAGNFLHGDKAISLGDYQGTHTEWYLQFTQVQ